MNPSSRLRSNASEHSILHAGSARWQWSGALFSGHHRRSIAKPADADRWVVFHTTNSVTLRQIYAVPVTEREVPFEEWMPIVTDFGMQPSWSEDGRGAYQVSLRDGTFCVGLQTLDPSTMRRVDRPRAVQHLHEPRLRAVAASMATNDVHGGYLYATLTETTGNIWMLHDGTTPLHAAR